MAQFVVDTIMTAPTFDSTELETRLNARAAQGFRFATFVGGESAPFAAVFVKEEKTSGKS